MKGHIRLVPVVGARRLGPWRYDLSPLPLARAVSGRRYPSRRPPTTSPPFQITHQKVSTFGQDLTKTKEGRAVHARPSRELSRTN